MKTIFDWNGNLLVTVAGSLGLLLLLLAFSDFGAERLRIPAAISGSVALQTWALLIHDRAKYRER